LLNSALDFADNLHLQNIGVIFIALTLIIFGLRQKIAS
jgi:hypothetical protein